MTNTTKQKPNKKKYPAPYSLRLTPAEREKLKQEAGNMPLSAYIRKRLFDHPEPRKHRFYNDEYYKQQEILNILAQTKIPNNLNQIAKACNTGKIKLDKQTKKLLREACQSVIDIRKNTILAMGLKLPQEGLK